MKAIIKYRILTITIGVAMLMLSRSDTRAQIFTGGVEGEITTSSVKISDIKNATVNVINGKDITGYEAGIFLRFGFPVSPLYVKPKFLISHQSGMVNVNEAESSSDVSFAVTRLNIPVLIGLKILGPLSIEGGPVYNRILTVTKDFNGSNIDLKPEGLGYRIGANAQLGIVGLNIAYEGVKNNSSASSSLASFETPDKLIFGASLSFGR